MEVKDETSMVDSNITFPTELNNGQDLLEGWETQFPPVFSEIKETSFLLNNITFRPGENYSLLKGITTFRGNNYRDSASYGSAEIKEKRLHKIWEISIGAIDKWTGVGWNGQPAIVKWDYNLQNSMNLFDEKRTKEDLKEVIYATLDGNIYFLDLEDGIYTRKPIKVGAPIKGSVTIDPRGYPLLYAGQGIDIVKGKQVKIGYRIFNLYNSEELFFLDGKDKFALRDWGAFDSNILVCRETDTMLLVGENGLFYRVKLNTKTNFSTNTISINPLVAKYRYKAQKKDHQGTENSIAIYKSYAYFADNGGILTALNINTLKPLWVRDVTDDTDSTIVIEEKNNQVTLYTGCEVDKQGTSGRAYIRKIDAMTGNLLWEKSFKAYLHKTVNGGLLATPVVGKKGIDNLVIFNIARHDSLSRGILVALDKETGEEVWTLQLDKYSWSSPVDVYTPGGEAYLVLGDSNGNLQLIEGKTGKLLHSINLGHNIEGSPAVYENTLVIGTRGQRIFGVQIK